PPPTSTLFPYTTLFRSVHRLNAVAGPTTETVFPKQFSVFARRLDTRQPMALSYDGHCALGFFGVCESGKSYAQGAAIEGAVYHRSEEHTSELQSLAYLV